MKCYYREKKLNKFHEDEEGTDPYYLPPIYPSSVNDPYSNENSPKYSCYGAKYIANKNKSKYSKKQGEVKYNAYHSQKIPNNLQNIYENNSYSHDSYQLRVSKVNDSNQNQQVTTKTDPRREFRE